MIVNAKCSMIIEEEGTIIIVDTLVPSHGPIRDQFYTSMTKVCES